MFVWIKRGFLSLAILGLIFTGAAQAQNGQGRGNGASGDVVQLRPAGPVHGQYIVVFEDDVTDPRGLANALARQNGFALRHTFGVALRGFAARMPAPIAETLALDPDVAYVEQDLYAQTQLHGNNFQTLTEGVNRIDADLNATADIDDTDDDRVNVDIAIIDTGIDLAHPDLNVFREKSFIRRVKSGDDDNGHGTHVAGTAAAVDNGIGVVGVAPGARLWALKVLNRNGSGSFADVIRAIDYVTANAAEIEVVNMSLSGTGQLNSLRAAIQASVNAGVVYVVAAGNDSRDVYGADGVFEAGNDDTIPAAYPEVAAISAMGDTDGEMGGLGQDTSYGTGDDTFASFTNFSRSVVADNPVNSFGAAIDLAAPGVDVWSTYMGGMYAQISGTSMASPHVAGAAALEAATNGRATDAAGVADIRQTLIDAAQAQDTWGPANTNDSDANPEGLLFVADDAFAPPNDAPQVSIASPTATTFNSGVLITFSGSASDSEDDDVILTATLAWNSDRDGPIGTGASASMALSDGPHVITASVTDTGGEYDSASISITVGTAPTIVNVDSVSYDTEGGKNGDKHLLIMVALLNDLDDPVVGASVSIDLFRDNVMIASGAGSTDGGGLATFSLKNAKSGYCYSTEVTNVTASGLTWDSTEPANEYCK